MKSTVSLRDALADPKLLGVLAGDSWAAWRALLLAAMGEPLEPDELETFRRLTGGRQPPPSRVEEFVGIIGRRGGKSRAMATLACYIAGLCDHHDALVTGERGIVLLIAPDQRQARVALDYATGILEASPILRQLIANRTTDALELTNGITLEVRAASFRRLRGPTYVAVLADEAAYWHDDALGSANADSEILAAVRPGLSTTRGPLIIITSPYAKRGEVFELYSRNYGDKGDPLILVAQGTSRDLNPTLPQSVIDRALARDPERFAAEYMATFRGDLETFITREAVMACVQTGTFERKPERRWRYFAFADPSGGISDSFTLAISHKETSTAVLDVLRERKPPFSPEQVVEEFSDLCRSYRVTKVRGDRYGGEWPREQFRKHGLNFETCDQSKSELYVDLLPLINSGGVDLLDSDRLVNQLTGLERRTARGGRDSVDHRPGGHDDLANAVAGALVLAASRRASGDRDRAASVMVEGLANFNPHIYALVDERRDERGFN
jgi:hypothetical protein